MFASFVHISEWATLSKAFEKSRRIIIDSSFFSIVISRSFVTLCCVWKPDWRQLIIPLLSICSVICFRMIIKIRRILSRTSFFFAIGIFFVIFYDTGYLDVMIIMSDYADYVSLYHLYKSYWYVIHANRVRFHLVYLFGESYSQCGCLVICIIIRTYIKIFSLFINWDKFGWYI
jgi:hypothetical protein